MTDFGNPFGVDLATTIFGSGLTLIVSAGAMRYGYLIPEWNSTELIGMAGVAMLVIGALYGFVLMLSGLR